MEGFNEADCVVGDSWEGYWAKRETLEKMFLHDCKMDDADLVVLVEMLLKHFPKLTMLSLHFNNIINIEPLKKITQLTWLK